METFLYKYRKLFIVVYVILLIALPFKIYKDIVYFSSVGKWAATGKLLNDFAIYLLLPLYVLSVIHKVYKRNQKEAAYQTHQQPNVGATK